MKPAPAIRKLPPSVIALIHGVELQAEFIAQCEADASSVEVELQEASVGCALEVRDNGRGIAPEDFMYLGQRGARSGAGRGESLAGTIARYQRVVVQSKVPGQQTWIKAFEGGQARCGAAAPRGARGTTVRLEAESGARSQVTAVRRRLERMALLRPQLAMRFSTSPSKADSIELEPEDTTSRVQHILGLGCARALCRVQFSSEQAACGLEGVISRLQDGHASDQFMFLYINGRFVEQTPIHQSIANYYATGSVAAGRGPASVAAVAAGDVHPFFVLNLCCPMEWYDLDFLPDRSQVQFRDWHQPVSYILECLQQLWLACSKQEAAHCQHQPNPGRTAKRSSTDSPRRSVQESQKRACTRSLKFCPA
ncbi:unnamed protein product [Effrenium voratum]|nr:unnamed protein product [Effrenium voratum]